MKTNRLYQQRTLTGNLNMVFDFVGENWKLWLKMMLYFLLPFSVILGTTVVPILKGQDFDESFSTLGIVALVFSLTIGSAVALAIEMLLLQWHDKHCGSLDGCNVATMWRMLPKALLKGLAVIAIIASLQLLALIAVVIPIVGIVGLLAVLPVYLVCPIMLLEPNNSWIGAIRRAFSLGYKKWGTLILIMAVMGVEAILFSNAATFPLAMLTYVESLLEEPVHHSVFWSFVGDIAFYVLSVAGSFLLFMEVGLLFHAVTCHYGSVAAEAEDIGLESEIDNFDQLR